MDFLRQYILSVICAALITGILHSFMKKHAAGELIKILCGILLTVTMLRPLLEIAPNLDMYFFSSYLPEAERISEEGKSMAAQAICESIKKKTEAYILDKADALQEEILAEVSTNQDGIPVLVRISGDVSHKNRAVLEAVIETDLGITKENQIWTGSN